MDKFAGPTPSSCSLHPATAESLESALSSVSYEQDCPYRTNRCDDGGLGLKFRLVEILSQKDSFGDRQYIDTNDPRPCINKCLCRFHDRTESHFVFLAQKTENTFDLIIYDATLYFRIAEALGWDHVGATFSQGGFVVDGFALLRNCEVLIEDLNVLTQQEAEDPSYVYLVSSLRLLVDGFLGDEEVFRSFGHTHAFLHEQQYISFGHWKKFQASRAVKDIMLLDHGFQEAEWDRASTLRRHNEEFICETEHDHGPGLPVRPRVQYQDSTLPLQENDLTTEIAAPISESLGTFGNSGEDFPTSSLAEFVAAPTVEAPKTPEEVGVINFTETLIGTEYQEPVTPCPSLKQVLEQLSGPTITESATSVPWHRDIQTASAEEASLPYQLLEVSRSFHCALQNFGDTLHVQQKRRDLEGLLWDRGYDRTPIFSYMLSSIQEAAESGSGDILNLLDIRYFDPRIDVRTAAARMEKSLQVTMRCNLQETGEILVEYYLRSELYKWGNLEWIAYVAARHRCHWILRSIMPKVRLHPVELAYQAAKHATGEPLQATLQVLSSFEPDLFRLCIDHAAKAADNRSVRALLSAAQESRDLRHASIVWEAAMAGDAQPLCSTFGPGARKTVLITLQEAGNIRLRQVHELFTRKYPRLLRQLRKASCQFSINIEGFMYKWQDLKSNSSPLAWDREIKTLKHLVQGNVPDNVSDMMLVLSIAEAFSTTLDSTCTPSKSWRGEFLQDLPRWQLLLPRSQHAAYAYCARGLWSMKLSKCISPEPLPDLDLLDRFQGLAICLLRDTMDILGLNENASGNSLHSSQQRRACHGLAETESQESHPRSSPYREASTRWLGSLDDQIGHVIDPEPDEASSCPRIWQAITERLRYSIPSSKVHSIFMMMGAVFFCLLQFTFFLRLCRTTMIHTSTSAYTPPFCSNLFSEPLGTLRDKCDFLELYLGLHEPAIAGGALLQPRLSVSIPTPASSEGQDVSRNDFHVGQSDNRALKGQFVIRRSQNTIESSPSDNEPGSTPFFKFSARSNSEASSAAKAEYICTVCDLPFPTSSNFHRHMREKHEKTRFVCDKCGKDFSRADYVKKHRCRGKALRARARAVKLRTA